MDKFLPYGGQEIALLRMAGKRPADMVIVSFIGPLREGNPVVIARPERSYDWRFLRRLEVLIVAASSIPAHVLKRHIDGILQFDPDYLGVWLADRKDGFNVAWGSYRPKAREMRQFTRCDKERYQSLGAGYAGH